VAAFVTISKKWHDKVNKQWQGMLVSAGYATIFFFVFIGMSVGDYWMW